jgi:hypothetical protein
MIFDLNQAQLRKATLSEQERLVAGLCEPRNLLDVVRHFTLFTDVDGHAVKAVCRYQQYRAVTRAIDRLRTGKTRLQDGEHDRRGGIVWHTQGSGKSLTMVFLIRTQLTSLFACHSRAMTSNVFAAAMFRCCFATLRACAGSVPASICCLTFRRFSRAPANVATG